MSETALDQAYSAMMGEPDDEILRSSYYSVLAASEVFVLLEEEAVSSIVPKLIEMEGVRYALVFDTEARLSEFAQTQSPYAGMSGRALVESLTGARLGLAINAGVAETANFIPPEALDWMQTRLGEDLSTGDEEIEELLSPDALEVPLLQALDARLAVFAGPDRSAYLVKAQYAKETANLMIFVGIPEAAKVAIAGALAEALRFLAPDMALDSVFVEQGDGIIAPAARVGLRFDMNKVMADGPEAPGSDPDKPPILH